MSAEIISKRKVARTARMVEMVKKGDVVKSDIGEYSGLRVVCGKAELNTH